MEPSKTKLASPLKTAIYTLLYSVLLGIIVSVGVCFMIVLPFVAIYLLFEFQFYAHVSDKYGAFVALMTLIFLCTATLYWVISSIRNRFGFN